MNDFSVIGFWKFKSNHIQLENNDWHRETLSGGTMAFSESGEVILLVRSEQGPWGYTGKFKRDGDRIRVQVETSTSDDLAGSTLERNVNWINQNEFYLTGLESHTTRNFKTHLVRV